MHPMLYVHSESILVFLQTKKNYVLGKMYHDAYSCFSPPKMVVVVCSKLFFFKAIPFIVYKKFSGLVVACNNLIEKYINA